MAVFMSLRPMPGMFVVVPSVFSRVFVVMDFALPCVTMLMAVLMEVFVGMGMSVFVAVFACIMRMFVGESVGMVMGMQMFMFVCSFHRELL